jgi:putative transposase
VRAAVLIETTGQEHANLRREICRDGEDVGAKQVSDRIWLVSFMDYDLGYFDDETCRLEPIENPFGPKVLPMCPE